MEAEVRPSGASSTPTKESIYTALRSYAFNLDPDFQAGLVSLTSDPSLAPPQRDETIFQAQCFYFARKYNLPPIEAEEYKTWLATKDGDTQRSGLAEQHPTHIAAQPLSEAAPEATPEAIQTKPEDGPPYPASFESIVDLITRNQPIPGIEEIPDTVLDASLSAPNHTVRRKKPWETDEAAEDVKPVLGDAAEVRDGKPTGIVGILQPIKKLEDGEGTNPGALEEDASTEATAAT